MHFLPNPNDPILNPSLWLGSFELREPITTITDFMVSMASAIALLYFLKHKGERTENFKLYRTYFFFYMIGMTSAAWLGHGLQAYISSDFKMIGWICSAIGSIFLIYASLNQLKNKIGAKGIQILKVLAVLKAVVFIAIILNPSTRNFKIVQIYATIDLVGIVLPLQFLNYYFNKEKGSLIITSAIIYGAIPGIVFSNQISISKWFNYHDISHVLMAIFIIIMFSGSYKLSVKN